MLHLEPDEVVVLSRLAVELGIEPVNMVGAEKSFASKTLKRKMVNALTLARHRGAEGLEAAA